MASAAYADRFAAGLRRGATVRVLDDAGHMLPYERTDDVVDAIRRFVV